jgi:hypothetical protein
MKGQCNISNGKVDMHSTSPNSGSSHKNGFYHIEVRPKSDFSDFHVQDFGRMSGIERIAGKRHDGLWVTHKWLIRKELAHLEGVRLVPDSEQAQRVLEQLGPKLIHVGGDVFRIPRQLTVRETKKPVTTRRRAK